MKKADKSINCDKYEQRDAPNGTIYPVNCFNCIFNEETCGFFTNPTPEEDLVVKSKRLREKERLSILESLLGASVVGIEEGDDDWKVVLSNGRTIEGGSGGGYGILIIN